MLQVTVGTGRRLRRGVANFVMKPVAGLAAAGLVMAVASTAQARVTKIVIDNKVSPAFNGASFGSALAIVLDREVPVAQVQVDPADRIEDAAAPDGGIAAQPTA